jgi:hypothetical protein
MKRTALLILLLSALVVEGGLLFIENNIPSIPSVGWRISFFFLIPLGLAVFVWFQFRWAAMTCVIYATVGLAMDIATIAQVPTLDTDVVVSLTTSVISGLVNFLLIVFGGRSFLDVRQEPMPLESRPPSPPSPS